MNGDNNLEPYAVANFRQLAQVGSNDQVNVIVQFDRINKYYPFPASHTVPDWPQTLRFRVAKGMEPIPANAVEDIGEADMGSGKTLAQFVSWGMQKYPAKRFALIIWDHGQGWRLFVANLLKRQRAIVKSRSLAVPDTVTALRSASVLLRAGVGVASNDGQTAPFRSAPGAPYRSVSNDETNQSVLYNRDMQDSLKLALGGQTIDVIGFDACLMAMVETGYALREIGRYMVASEELEPGRGWNYSDWLRRLEANPTQDASGVAKMTVDSYRATYTSPETGDPATTLSAIDLGQVERVATTLSQLSDALISNIDLELQGLIESRAATSTYAPGYFFYHIDIVQFVSQLAARTANTTVKDAAMAVKNAVIAAVSGNYAGTERTGSYGSNGLAIYFPSSEHEHTGDPYAEAGYEKANQVFPVEFVQKERWSDFLHLLWSRVP